MKQPLPAHPPAAFVVTKESLRGLEQHVQLVNGHLTVLDLFAIQLAPYLFALLGPDGEGCDDGEIARRLWGMAQTILEHRPEAPPTKARPRLDLDERGGVA